MRNAIWTLTAMWLAIGSHATAQEVPSSPPAQPGPQLLQKFVGEWTTESEGVAGPDQPPIKLTGTIRGRRLGDFWVVNEMEAEIMGTRMQALQTIGYDVSKQKYVGSWVDSMSSYMWQYEGTLGPAGTVLTLEAEGPNMMAEGKLAKFRDSYEFKSPDHIVARSSMLTEAGEWVTFMTGHARRKK